MLVGSAKNEVGGDVDAVSCTEDVQTRASCTARGACRAVDSATAGVDSATAAMAEAEASASNVTRGWADAAVVSDWESTVCANRSKVDAACDSVSVSTACTNSVGTREVGQQIQAAGEIG